MIVRLSEATVSDYALVKLAPAGVGSQCRPARGCPAFSVSCSVAVVISVKVMSTG